MNEVLKEMPPAYPWGDTLSLFHETDVRLCNLECALTDRETPWSATPKTFHFRSDAKNVETLTVAHMDAVSLANNHALDYDYEGVLHMIHTLQEAGIHYAGAGATFREASAPAIWSVNGTRLGLLAFTDNEPAWEATGEQPGVWYVPIALQDKRARQLLEVVRRTKEAVDLLIVSAHWGPNWGYAPPAEHGPFAQALIDAGADVIFGHSVTLWEASRYTRRNPSCIVQATLSTIIWLMRSSGMIGVACLWLKRRGLSYRVCCSILRSFNNSRPGLHRTTRAKPS